MLQLPRQEEGDVELRKRLEPVLAPYKGQKGATIPILQKVQAELGYLPEEAVREIAHFLGLSANEVYGIATFYAQFRFNRPGKHSVRVCLGTACHVRGSQRILEEIERGLKITSGETTADRRFSLERVACFGSCALAPVMVVDSDVYGRLNISKAKDILAHVDKPS